MACHLWLLIEKGYCKTRTNVYIIIEKQQIENMIVPGNVFLLPIKLEKHRNTCSFAFTSKFYYF